VPAHFAHRHTHPVLSVLLPVQPLCTPASLPALASVSEVVVQALQLEAAPWCVCSSVAQPARRSVRCALCLWPSPLTLFCGARDALLLVFCRTPSALPVAVSAEQRVAKRSQRAVPTRRRFLPRIMSTTVHALPRVSTMMSIHQDDAPDAVCCTSVAAMQGAPWDGKPDQREDGSCFLFGGRQAAVPTHSLHAAAHAPHVALLHTAHGERMRAAAAPAPTVLYGCTF